MKIVMKWAISCRIYMYLLLIHMPCCQRKIRGVAPTEQWSFGTSWRLGHTEDEIFAKEKMALRNLLVDSQLSGSDFE